MQKQLDSGRFEKRPRTAAKPPYKPAQSRMPEGSEGNTTPSGLTHLEAEDFLAERLKQHGCDPYDGGPYATYADRLGACIVRNRMQCVIVGRREGKPESYAACFERLCGRPLTKPEARRSTSTRYPTSGKSEKPLEGTSALATGGEGDAM
jgi:hypothetical protein